MGQIFNWIDGIWVSGVGEGRDNRPERGFACAR